MRTNALHSMFTDSEADAPVARWEIVSKEKQARCSREAAQRLSEEEWTKLPGEDDAPLTEAEWQANYSQRTNACPYTHL